jgi:hypothetical protein
VSTSTYLSGLPDFSWNITPKPEKMELYTKTGKNAPNERILYQMSVCKMFQASVKYSDWQ